MTAPEELPQIVACLRCGTPIEVCAFCESGICPDMICFRCLRADLGQSLAQPHAHGG
jgi:hypothetical protein